MTDKFWNLSIDPSENLPSKKFPRNLKQAVDITLAAEYDLSHCQGGTLVLTPQQVRELIERGVMRFSTEDDMKAALKVMDGYSEEIEITFSETQ